MILKFDLYCKSLFLFTFFDYFLENYLNIMEATLAHIIHLCIKFMSLYLYVVMIAFSIFVFVCSVWLLPLLYILLHLCLCGILVAIDALCLLFLLVFFCLYPSPYCVDTSGYSLILCINI